MKFIEMEPLETDLLHAIDAAGGLSPERTARYLRHIVSSLTYLHANRNMTHRDIKPQNIFVAGRVAKIGDFGCVGWLLSDEPLAVMGTPNYLPYNIWHFDVPMGVRADIWGCGCTLKLGSINRFSAMFFYNKIQSTFKRDMPGARRVVDCQFIQQLRYEMIENKVAFEDEPGPLSECPPPDPASRTWDAFNGALKLAA